MLPRWKIVYTVNVKTSFSHVTSGIAGGFAHVLALQVLVDFEESARSRAVRDADLDVRVGVEQFVVEIPTDI